MNQERMPLVEAMHRYQEKDPVRFHVPGHKGRGTGPLSSLYPLDLTEIPGLDDLHHPEEAILYAQQLASEVFGSDETFFLVGGSTVGNLAMLLAACKPGEEILVQRNVHKSVIHGLILSQASPVYLVPELDEKTGLPITVSISELLQKLQEHPQAKAVFLTNPNYYGMGVDLQPYAKACRQYGIPLLVDEAHGAHYGLHDDLPRSAMDSGATAAVQSTHKMLPSLTMSSMLHVKGDLLDRGRLKQALAMVQSSSPSYPLMASLDLARHYLVHEGRKDVEHAIQLSKKLKQGIESAQIPWLQVVDRGEKADSLDPLKVTIRTYSKNYHGFRLKEYLESKGIYPELADDQHVLLVISTHSSERDVERTVEAIEQLEVQYGGPFSLFDPAQFQPFSNELVLTPYEVFNERSVTVPFEEAEGKICAEMIVPYPPGIPVINPGERMSKEIMNYLQELQRLGCRFHGISDSKLGEIRVVNIYNN
ncbi:aminotransferase class I/II-fold pyridoxal phosphate-dependent enzyme [Ammoniphilus sp. CFH 90114]|uniref:aminotransferase class I/II-fold pyridoxal phosphate-dependent enzyme n=1 Tax=Ammoniphilus sp. CFH 90114 TaxID=2493665 RepID=UPI00100F7069|nr:aminotransferase class I/II-fold pyridoxal phosphate-dependent enzyme [Ammoniphilus sp. CFH 90114]RXT08982.1 aminotransferase class I/II-fold pyridoxal phosphate-dependent enzyme [Ammoniphilus sp. CFH 90114]